MADAPYTRSFSFAGFQANQPAKPLPGQRVDIEFDNVAREFTAIRALIAVGVGGGGGPALDLPMPARTIKANLKNETALATNVTLAQLGFELGVGSGGGALPDWSDIQNKPAFGTAATRDVGAGAGMVAAGDDPRIVGALQAANNGSDFPNKAVTRSNLGLKGAALLDVGTTAGTVMAGNDPRVPQQALGAAAYLDAGVAGGVMLFNDARVGRMPYVALLPTDGTDATPAFVAACNTVLARSRGGTIFIPDGRYNCLTRPIVTIPAGKRLTIVGSGAGATSFLFTNTPGFQFFFGSKYSSITAYDFEVVTNRPNSGSAILLNNPTPEGNPAETAQSHFYNITMRGEVGENPNLGYVTTNYWTIGYNVQNVSNIHWNGGLIVGATQEGQTPTFPGGATVTMLGIGIAVTGSPSGQLYACAFNMVGTTFNYLQRGFVYGSWIQGVTCVSCNFTQCIEGFYVADPAGSSLHGINITTSQFGCIGININVAGYCGAVTIEGNLIVPQPFQNGIRLNSTGFTVGGNAINGLFANGTLPDGRETLEYGVSVTNNGAGTITGNAFSSLYGCVFIGSSAQLVNVGTNSRVACKNYLVNQGAACRRVVETALEASYNG